MDQMARIGFLTVLLCFLSNLQATDGAPSQELTKNSKALAEASSAVQAETSAPAQTANAENESKTSSTSITEESNSPDLKKQGRVYLKILIILKGIAIKGFTCCTI